MIIKPAKRTESVREYYFSMKNRELDSLNAERAGSGRDRIINLGIGSPDGMPPAAAVETVSREALKKGVHSYQSYTGLPELRQAFALWYRRYYGVELDPSCEIQPLVGSKEGILLISLAFLDKGDRVLVPDPGYPTYTSATRLCEAVPVTYDLTAENGWMPDFEALEKADLEGVKLMWTNYPNMPTGARPDEELYRKLARFAERKGILVVNDNPYSFILNDKPLSILAAEGSKGCCMELNSLSKAHNMAGWRIGMVAGDAPLVAEVLKVKSQMDSGMFKPLQLAAIEALSQGPEWYASLNAEYSARRNAAAEVMAAAGAACNTDSSGLFLWGRVTEDNPLIAADGSDKTLGEKVSDAILYKAGVFITPGFVFGKNGSDYIRISLCAPVETLLKARDKILDIKN